jgi:hypothetical protein
MKDRNDENLKGLFERLLGAEQANEAVRDVMQGERILREYPAPEPDKELIAGIKSNVAAMVLPRRARVFRKVVGRAVAVAAAIIILAAVSVRFLEIDGDRSGRVAYASMIPKAVWESEDIAADDIDLAVLTAAVKQIEGEFLVLQLGENGHNGDRVVMELEIEFVEIKSDFWKE